jgi:hypothetical protein
MQHRPIDGYVVEISRDAFGNGWTLEDDRRFWKRIHGRSGLLQLRRDAKKLTDFCLRVSEHRSDRDFLVYRLHLMTICILLSFVECVPRVVWKELPHFFAKFAAQIFCEMLSRAELVAEENGRALTGVFGDDNGAPIHPFTYRSPARGAARRAAERVARPGTGPGAEAGADPGSTEGAVAGTGGV